MNIWMFVLQLNEAFLSGQFFFYTFATPPPPLECHVLFEWPLIIKPNLSELWWYKVDVALLVLTSKNADFEASFLESIKFQIPV